jgi:hypothetical protein
MRATSASNAVRAIDPAEGSWSNSFIAAGLRDGRLQLALTVRPSKRGAFRGLRFEELLREQSVLLSRRTIHLRSVAPSHSLMRPGNRSSD